MLELIRELLVQAELVLLNASMSRVLGSKDDRLRRNRTLSASSKAYESGLSRLPRNANGKSSWPRRPDAYVSVLGATGVASGVDGLGCAPSVSSNSAQTATLQGSPTFFSGRGAKSIRDGLSTSRLHDCESHGLGRALAEESSRDPLTGTHSAVSTCAPAKCPDPRFDTTFTFSFRILCSSPPSPSAYRKN